MPPGLTRLLKDLDPDLPMLYTDQDKMKSLCMHLLRNAVKFTQAGTVTVSARHQAEMLTVAVTDTGIGIKSEVMKRVLIVEDVELNRDLLVQLLEEDYDLLTATNGAAGIELAERECPDLILMDLSLPVVDGWEATRRIKANPALRHIPIIALTAHAMMGDEDKARAAGCDDYLSKPIDEDLLYEKLARFLGEGLGRP